MNFQPGLPLAENKSMRFTTFILLYFSQGIPEGITIFGIPAWLAMNGKSAAEIAGFSAVTLLPFSFKILLAPIMEKYVYLPMGRRRPWLLFGQLGILCSLLGLATVPDPLHNLFMVTAMTLSVHLFIMFQDIATDSLVIDIVPLNEQGRANSLMWGSKTIGNSLSLFAGSWLINHYGFSSAVLTMSVFVVGILFVPLLVRERKGEKRMPWSEGAVSPEAAFLTVASWSKLFRSFRQVVVLRNSVIMLVMVFITMGALHFMRTLLPVFTIQELGWTNLTYSKITSTSNLAGGIVGMLLGGWIIQRYGVAVLLKLGYILIAILSASMGVASSISPHPYLAYGFIGIFCTLLTLINIGVLALAMELCWKRISALQFTFSMTVFNAGLASGAAFLGYLRSFFGWPVLFGVFTLFVLLAMLMLRFIQTHRHRSEVEDLEKRYIEILESEASLLNKPGSN